MKCVGAALDTEPTLGRYLYFKALAAIPVFAALVGLIRYSSTFVWPLVYVGLCLLHAGIMFTIKCPHCAYYKMGGSRHRCFMWWGMPKLFKPRAGPEKPFVGVYAPIGMAVLTFFPVYWLASDWVLLAIYLWSIGVVVATIGRMQCTRCLNFECGHNTVPQDVREAYLETREPVETI